MIDIVRNIRQRQRIANSTVLSPKAVLLDVQSIAENNSIGAVVGVLSSVDINATETFTYTLVAGTGDTDNASFTIDGRSLKAAEAFNYEVKNSYSIRVRSTDSGSQYTERAFTIIINDVSE